MSRKLPNMTATEIANAKPPAAPLHGIIGDMVDRELATLRAISFDEAGTVVSLSLPGDEDTGLTSFRLQEW